MDLVDQSPLYRSQRLLRLWKDLVLQARVVQTAFAERLVIHLSALAKRAILECHPNAVPSAFPTRNALRRSHVTTSDVWIRARERAALILSVELSTTIRRACVLRDTREIH